MVWQESVSYNFIWSFLPPTTLWLSDYISFSFYKSYCCHNFYWILVVFMIAASALTKVSRLHGLYWHLHTKLIYWHCAVILYTHVNLLNKRFWIWMSPLWLQKTDYRLQRNRQSSISMCGEVGRCFIWFHQKLFTIHHVSLYDYRELIVCYKEIIKAPY